MGVTGAAGSNGLLQWAAGLRFPRLLALTVALFALDLLIPDLIPFADEILLGLTALVLGSFRRRPGPSAPDEPTVIEARPVQERKPPAE
jgi:hypothetical protein